MRTGSALLAKHAACCQATSWRAAERNAHDVQLANILKVTVEGLHDAVNELENAEACSTHEHGSCECGGGGGGGSTVLRGVNADDDKEGSVAAVDDLVVWQSG